MRAKASLLCLVFVWLATQTRGQTPPAEGQSATLQARLRKTVGFLRVEYLRGTETWEARGTCFFVSVEDERNGEKRRFGYLVTNRHVASPEEGGTKLHVLRTWLRLNLKQPVNGKESEEGLLQVGPDRHWFFPSDDSVDIAAFPVVPDVDRYDFQAIPLPMFATRDVIDAHHIEEGDRVLFAGFFYQLPGLKRVSPIVREGILAMMPEVDMETTMHKPGRVYLVDVHAFGGNSGAPVFIAMDSIKAGVLRLTGLGGPSSFPYRLLGVVSGYYYEDAQFKLTVATTLEGKTQANSGISIVVPAEQLKALLELPELQRIRDAEVERQQLSKGLSKP
jgi:hypothetical protein